MQSASKPLIRGVCTALLCTGFFYEMGYKYFLVKNLEDFKNIFDLLLHISK